MVFWHAGEAVCGVADRVADDAHDRRDQDFVHRVFLFSRESASMVGGDVNPVNADLRTVANCHNNVANAPLTAAGFRLRVFTSEYRMRGRR